MIWGAPTDAPGLGNPLQPWFVLVERLARRFPLLAFPPIPDVPATSSVPARSITPIGYKFVAARASLSPPANRGGAAGA